MTTLLMHKELLCMLSAVRTGHVGREDRCSILSFQRLIDFRGNCQGWLGAEFGPEHLHMQASNN